MSELDQKMVHFVFFDEVDGDVVLFNSVGLGFQLPGSCSVPYGQGLKDTLISSLLMNDASVQTLRKYLSDPTTIPYLDIHDDYIRYFFLVRGIFDPDTSMFIISSTNIMVDFEGCQVSSHRLAVAIGSLTKQALNTLSERGLLNTIQKSKRPRLTGIM